MCPRMSDSPDLILPWLLVAHIIAWLSYSRNNRIYATWAISTDRTQLDRSGSALAREYRLSCW